MKILLKTGAVLHVKDAKTFDEIQDDSGGWMIVYGPRNCKLCCIAMDSIAAHWWDNEAVEVQR